MKKLKILMTLFGLALTFSFTQTAVSAPNGFQSTQDVSGTWVLEYTRFPKQAKKGRGEIWVFKGDQLVMKGIKRLSGDKYDSPPITIKVEAGQLKVSIFGRSGRFDSYSLIERTASTMELKSNLGETFYFVKK